MAFLKGKLKQPYYNTNKDFSELSVMQSYSSRVQEVSWCGWSLSTVIGSEVGAYIGKSGGRQKIYG